MFLRRSIRDYNIEIKSNNLKFYVIFTTKLTIYDSIFLGIRWWYSNHWTENNILIHILHLRYLDMTLSDQIFLPIDYLTAESLQFVSLDTIYVPIDVK